MISGSSWSKANTIRKAANAIGPRVTLGPTMFFIAGFGKEKESGARGKSMSSGMGAFTFGRLQREKGNTTWRKTRNRKPSQWMPWQAFDSRCNSFCIGFPPEPAQARLVCQIERAQDPSLDHQKVNHNQIGEQGRGKRYFHHPAE